MPKIKEIIITDFRAYLGQSTFSFEGKLGLANLVVIYGPNGFGKTSFFDAVEWTFSNQIKRFQAGVLKSEIESKDYSNNNLIVLSNRNATTPGKIKISTDDEKFIERVVSPRKVQNEEVKFDYRQGVLSGDFTEEELFMLSETNVLTQDQIDSFLRFMSPEQKFDALKEFWPQGADAASVFKTLTQYQRIVSNSISATAKDIDQVEGSVAKLLNSEHNYLKINATIDLLNESEFYDLHYPKINTDINEDVYSSIIDINETYKRLVANVIEEQQSYSVKLSDLAKIYSEYVVSVRLATENRNELNRIAEIEEDFAKIKIHQTSVSNIDQAIVSNDIKIKDAETLLNGWSDFLDEIYEIAYLKAEITFALQNNQNLISRKNLFEESLSNLKYSKTSLEEALAKETKLNSLIDFNKGQVSKFQQDTRDGSTVLEFIDLIIAEVESKIELLLFQRSELHSISDFYERDKLGTEFDNLLNELNQTNENIKYFESQVTTLRVDRKQKETFSEGLNRIIQWGITHVKEHSLTECPMCNTDFNEVDLLLRSIQAEKADVIKISDSDNAIDEKLLITTYLKEDCTRLEAQMAEIISVQLALLSSEIIECQLNKDLLYNRRADISNKIEYAEKNVEDIFEVFIEQYPSLDGAVNFEDVRELSTNKIANFNSNIARLSTVIDWKEQNIRESESQLLIGRYNHETNQNKIQLITGRETYRLIEGLLIKYQLRADSVSFEYFTQGIDSLIMANELANNSKTEIMSLITELKSKVPSENGLIDEVELKLAVSKLKTDLETHDAAVKKFETEYQIVLNQNDYKNETLEVRQLNSTVKLNGLTALKTSLEGFNIDLEVIKENVEKNKLSNQLIEQKDKLVQLGRVKQKIDKAKSACGNYINGGIDTYFNKHVINKIYGKIEPHPNLKEIDIRSEITDDDKAPKLLIRAKNEIDELNPTLYLSTGQVNVLSLSIFLAKAFELGSDKINTIFMDDPVQNLSDINVLSFIDLLRTLILDQDKQVVISTHDEKFFKLLQNKLSEDYFKARYIELVAFGKLKNAEEIN
ncbi:MAG: AAA family ATPase [Pedobacter sp.]